MLIANARDSNSRLTTIASAWVDDKDRESCFSRDWAYEVAMLIANARDSNFRFASRKLINKPPKQMDTRKTNPARKINRLANIDQN